METENNKLIAEFMGYNHIMSVEYKIPRHNRMVPFQHAIKWEFFWSDFFKYDELKFHESWDWLMPVVEKIESLNYRVSITEFATNINDERLKISQWQNSDKMINTYKAVIEFIQWHNQNK